jgi:hypothetical protein
LSSGHWLAAIAKEEILFGIDTLKETILRSLNVLNTIFGHEELGSVRSDARAISAISELRRNRFEIQLCALSFFFGRLRHGGWQSGHGRDKDALDGWLN